MTTVSACLGELARSLHPLTDTPELDAQTLLSHVMDRSRSWLAAHPEALLDLEAASALEGSVQRLEHGEPLPYVIGEWEFFSLPFEVTPAVLIPRPETELLVERAIAWLRARTMKNEKCMVLDVGTGSGCIAITLAVNVPGIQVFATDVSSAAILVASRNAAKLSVTGRIIFLEADLIPGMEQGSNRIKGDSSAFDLCPQNYDLIVANLPYIPTRALQHLPVYTREPVLALDGGADGLEIIRRLLAKAPQFLAPGGLMLLEIEAFEGPAVLSLAYDLFDQAEIHLHQDLAGRDRLLEIQLLPGNGSS